MKLELAARIACAGVPLLGSSTVEQRIAREEPRCDLFGNSVALVGDVDGDSIEDWLVGAPLDAGAGSAWIYSGKQGAVLWSGFGASAGDEFGDCVSSLGDVDGDGVTDFAVGAPCGRNKRPGYVRIYAGSDRRLLHEFRGDPDEVRFGQCVAGVGDVDGDGAADIAMSSCLAERSRYEPCRARIFSGRDGALLHLLESPDRALGVGWAIAPVGDVDGDRCADFFVSEPYELTHCGRIVSGKSGETLHLLAGSLPSPAWRRGAAGIGDVDGDDVPDVAVGACGGTEEGGIVRVYSGRTGALVYARPGASTFGFSLAGVGDIDGDGVPDFCAGEVPWPTDGAVTMFSGGDGRVLWRIESPGPRRYFGYSLSRAGDADGDGLGDVLIGVASPWSPNEPGSVIVASGYDGTTIRELSLPLPSSPPSNAPP